MGIESKGFVNLLRHVEREDVPADIEGLQQAIQKIWNVISGEWQMNPPTETIKEQLQALQLQVGKFQTIEVSSWTKSKLVEKGVTSSTVEDILVELSGKVGNYLTKEEFAVWKQSIEIVLTSIQESISDLAANKQNIELSAETKSTLKLGDNVTTVESALIAINDKQNSTEYVDGDDIKGLFVLCTDKRQFLD